MDSWVLENLAAVWSAVILLLFLWRLRNILRLRPHTNLLEAWTTELREATGQPDSLLRRLDQLGAEDRPWPWPEAMGACREFIGERPSRLEVDQFISGALPLEESAPPNVRLRVERTWPSTLLGLGILGTFFGLTLSIYAASNQLEGQEQAVAAETSAPDALEGPDVEQAVRALLDGAWLAFLTSFVGLLLSLLLGRILHNLEEGFAAALGELTSSIRALIMTLRRAQSDPQVALFQEVHSDLRLLADSLAGIQQSLASEETLDEVESDILFQLHSQTQQLKQFNTDFAVQVGSALDAKLGQRFTPTLDKLSVLVERMTKQQSSAQEELLNRVLKSLEGRVNSAIEDSLTNAAKAIGDATKAMQEVLKSSRKETEAAGTKGKEILEEVALRLSEASKNTEEAIKKSNEELQQGIRRALEPTMRDFSTRVSRAADEIGASASHFSGATGRLAQSTEHTAQALAVLRDALARFETATDSVARTAPALVKSAELQASVAETQREIVDAVAETVRSHEAVSQRVNASLERLNKSNAAMESVWKQYEDRFSGIDKDVAAAFERLRAEVREYSTSVLSFTGSLDAHVAKVAGALGGAAQELSEAAEDLAEAVSKRR